MKRSGRVLVATLHYPDPSKVRSGTRPVTSLTIGRVGELMDHILITALILQRDLWP